MQGQQVAYVRVSTEQQNIDRQLAGLEFDRIFTDKVSGKDTNRPALTECLSYLREGDTLHVHSLDRLARNLVDLRNIIQDLSAIGVSVKAHKEGLTFGSDNNPMNTLLLSMLGAVAEFERSLILERQREGIAIAKANGLYKGRKHSLDTQQVQELRELAKAGVSKVDLAKRFEISRASIYNYLT